MNFKVKIEQEDTHKYEARKAGIPRQGVEIKFEEKQESNSQNSSQSDTKVLPPKEILYQFEQMVLTFNSFSTEGVKNIVNF